MAPARGLRLQLRDRSLSRNSKTTVKRPVTRMGKDILHWELGQEAERQAWGFREGFHEEAVPG